MVIEPPLGWTIETRHESVLILPPGGFDRGGIRYREKIRAIAPFPQLAREHFARSKFEPETSKPPERLITREGEHVWFVTSRGHLGKRLVQRDLALILLDDAHAQLSSVVFEEAEFSRFTQVVRDLAIADRHFLGVRRRWFEYTPPAMWRSRPRGFRAEWTPPDFPRTRAMLVVWPALPRDAVGDINLAFSGIFGTQTDVAVVDAMPVETGVSASGLMGHTLHLIRKPVGGPIVHTHGVVLMDERYVYPLRLEFSEEARGHRGLLNEVVSTIVRVPKPQVTTGNMTDGIWNE